jgi:hypothetical protein
VLTQIQNLLDPLRVPTDQFVPWRNPYSYEGTHGPWNEEELRRAFAKAGVIEVGSLDERRFSSTPFFALPVVGVSTPVPAGGPQSLSGSLGALPDYMSGGAAARDVWTLKVTKAGVLQRKDDAAEGGRRAPNRKWREWSVILTGSQLLFFRDPGWVASMLSQSEAPDAEAPAGMLRPDELLSVKDAIAVYDQLYTRVRWSLFSLLIGGLFSRIVPEHPPVRDGRRSSHPPTGTGRAGAE